MSKANTPAKNISQNVFALYRESLKSKETIREGYHFEFNQKHIFVLFGASGDLSTKKIYPNLWWLYRYHLLPPQLIIIGYGRSKLTVNHLKEKCAKYMRITEDERGILEEFWKVNYYVAGTYDEKSDFEKLNLQISSHENGVFAHRIFYLALPPLLYELVTVNIKKYCMASKGWSRLVIEKPFGRDAETSEQLSKHLDSLFSEQQIYRMDHYLGKEMVQSIMTLRFGNTIFTPSWNRHYIAAVKIVSKESFGVEGRGGYFDQYGIIRDVMQNHMLQVLALVAMEKPISCLAEDVRNEKVRVLRCIQPITSADILLGQYKGYANDPTITNKNSLTPTFAAGVLHIHNERWDGVPFIVKCGKALDESKFEVRIQFKDVPGDIFQGQTKRNEFIIKVQPEQGLYVQLMVKSPGVSYAMEDTTLNLSYASRYEGVKLPDAYETLILDVFGGSQMHFVSADELREQWRIYTPILHHIEKEKMKPMYYEVGSKGPPEADVFMERNNYICT